MKSRKEVTRRRSLAVLFGAWVMLASMPALAQAGVNAGMTVTFPDVVTVGDTGVAASIQMVNLNTAPEATETNLVCNGNDPAPSCGPANAGLVLTPSCGIISNAVCTQPDPGVLVVAALATGRLGTACGGVTFDVTIADPATGAVRFTPRPAGQRVALPPAQPGCTVDFTFSVQKSPTGDSDPGRAGIQTGQVASHSQVSNELSARVAVSANGTTVLPAPPPPVTTPPGTPQPDTTVPDTTPPGTTPPGATPPATTPPSATPAQPVAAVAGSRSPTARIVAPAACQGVPFNVVVSGRQIRRVVFTLDGRVVRTLTRPNSGARYTLRINPRALRPGIHRVVARTTFRQGSGTPPRILRVTFSRCARQRVAPRFTG